MAHVLPTLQLGVLPPPSSQAQNETTSRVAVQEIQAAKVDVESTTTKELEAALQEVALVDSETSIKAPEDNVLSPHTGDVQVEPADEEPLEDTPYPNIFAIGDAADAFGAIPAGHNAYSQVCH